MRNLEYTVRTAKPVDEAVRAVEQNTAAKGLRVLHTHDMSGALSENDFPREPVKIIEICNTDHAHQVSQREGPAAITLPCQIVVFQKKGQTYIGTMLPTAISCSFPGKGLEPIVGEVEKAVVSIIDNSAK